MSTIRPWRNGRRYRKGRPPRPPNKPPDPPKHSSNGHRRRGASLSSLIIKHGVHSKQVHRRLRRSNCFIPYSNFTGVPRRSPVPLRGGHRRPFHPRHLTLHHCTSGRHGATRRGKRGKKQNTNGHHGTKLDNHSDTSASASLNFNTCLPPSQFHTALPDCSTLIPTTLLKTYVSNISHPSHFNVTFLQFNHHHPSFSTLQQRY